MARLLTAQGEDVALRALFDTLNWCKVPKGSYWTKRRQMAQRIRYHGQNFLLLDTSGKARFFHEKLFSLRSRSTIWKGELLGRFLSKDAEHKSESLVLAELWDTNDRACVEYVPRSYAGVVTDFRPMRKYSKYLKEDSSWTTLAQGGVEVFTLPVYPAGMMLEPFVKHLADGLKTVISRTLRP